MNDKDLRKLRIDIGAVMKFALLDIPPIINKLNGVLEYTKEERLKFLKLIQVRLIDIQKKADEVINEINDLLEK